MTSIENENSKPAPGKTSGGTARWTWRRRLLAGFLVLCIALIIFIETTAAGFDFAAAHLITVFLSFLIFSIGLTWFTLFSGFTATVRWVTAGGLLAAIAGFFAVFQVDRLSGELIPEFRLRWQPPHDRTLDELAVATLTADFSRTAATDFPGFLGPARNGRLSGPALVTDWSQQEPRMVWLRSIGAGWSGFAAVNGFAVTMEQRGDQELVTCYRITDGKPIWTHATAGRHETIFGGIGPRSTPTIHKGRVYTLGATGMLSCLDGRDGSVLWEHNLPERLGVTVEDDQKAIAWGRANSPLIVDDLVVIPYGGPLEGDKTSLIAFWHDTGEVAWKQGDRQISYASPTVMMIAGKRHVVSVNEDNVSGHEIATGKVIWHFDWPGRSNANASVSQPQQVSPGELLLCKGYGAGAALLKFSNESDRLSYEVVWRNASVLKTKFTNAVVLNGHAYGLSDGILECVSLADGKRQWKRGRYGHGQLLAVGDVLLIQAEDGDLVLVAAAAERHQELSRVPALQGQTWNNLCLVGNRLLARNAEMAACYELPTR